MRVAEQPRSHRQRWVFLTLFVALALFVPASASAAAFTARLRAPNHSPTANKLWPITVTATRSNTKLSGSVRYEFLFDDQVVSHQPGHSFKRGVYHDTLKFPRDAIGTALTVRVIVSTHYGTVDLNWAVKTHA